VRPAASEGINELAAINIDATERFNALLILFIAPPHGAWVPGIGMWSIRVIPIDTLKKVDISL
jgi:hypothetical protein